MPHIAIDGPAGAGKSTVARILAARLGYLYVDTGAMYRALTYEALHVGVNLQDPQCLAALAARVHLELVDDRLYCDGREVTPYLRLPDVSRYVSVVASVPAVRARMVEWQREIAGRHPVVMDGRDIGSYVLPEAEYKFFITASLKERARRRWQELLVQGHTGLTLEQVQEELAVRDALDAGRDIAPLARAPDAICIDTTALTPEQVVESIFDIIKRG